MQRAGSTNAASEKLFPAEWFAARLERTLSWSRYERAIFVTVLNSGVLALGIVTLLSNLWLIPEEGIINFEAARQAFWVCWIFMAGNLALGVLYYCICKLRSRQDDLPHWLLLVVLILHIGEVFYVVYLLGLYSSVILIPMTLVYGVRVVFDRLMGATALALTCLGFVAFSLLYTRYGLPYAPYFHGDFDRIYRNPVLVWGSCGVAIFMLIIFYCILDFVMTRMRDLSVTDGLTRIANRRHFMELLDLEFERALRQDTCFSLVMIDLDHFKLVNDRYGHLAGDEVLAAVARLIRAETRKYDVVARYGGEEFVILLPDTPLEGARVVAERCRRKIDCGEILVSDHLRLRVTASMGLAAFPHESVSRVDDMIRLADTALYLAKESGRNRVSLPA